MLGTTITAIGLAVDKWWWRVTMVAILFYCTWLFLSTVDAHLASQMNLWYQNLGM